MYSDTLIGEKGSAYMKIIVASSNVFCRELSSYILSEAGYTVLEASDSSMLLGYLDDTHPLMVILDMRLVGGDYNDLVKRIEGQESVPVMLITNEAKSLERDQDIPLPCRDSMSWPYQADDFLTHVRALLP